MKYTHEDGTPFTKEEFLKKLETDDEFNEEFGNKGIDQISDLIKQLKENPDSRRLIVNAWAVDDIPNMVLPPCHYGFQVYTRELSDEERIKLFVKLHNPKGYEGEKITDTVQELLTMNNIPKRAISLMWNQRSVDTPLGLPFNIASYGLLLEIIAKLVGMIPDELIGNLGDCHIYSNQVDGVNEHIGRKYTPEERLQLLKEKMGHSYHSLIDELVPFDGGLNEYYESYKIPYYTRQPFELPKVTINTEHWSKDENDELDCISIINDFKSHSFCDWLLEADIQLYNYQYHPKIKIPLSN